MSITYPIEQDPQKHILAVILIFMTLAVLSVFLRILGRFKLGRWLDLSDYVMLVSLVAMIGLASALLHAVFKAGLGFHTKELRERFGDVSAPRAFLQHLMVSRVVAIISLALSKVSILILFCRVFTSKTLSLIANVTHGLIAFWVIGTIVLILRACSPIEYNWDKSIQGGSCGPIYEFWVASGIINIFADVIVLILPMPYIYKLQLATYKKVSLMITFGLAFFVLLVSVVKVAMIPQLDNRDITYSVQYSTIMVVIETSMSIIVANIPVLRPLFRRSLTTRGAQSCLSRSYSAARPGQQGCFTELRNYAVFGSGAGGVHATCEEEPLPMRPEKTYYNRIEALARGSEEVQNHEDVELGGVGGIVVKTEFTTSVEVVEVTSGNKAGRNSVRQSQCIAYQHRS